ncbi:peptidoglycan-binding protein [Actinomadura scrupuli]|uniref:peptidoglycan-binding protein n=1 Tax=Actinomadura scrupuli TaxID=559629 RepID=UPI003D98021F
MDRRPGGRPGRARTVTAAGLLVLLAAGGAAWAAWDTTGRSRPASATTTGTTTGTARVVRTDVAQRQQVAGTLGHAGAYNVIAGGGEGVVTRLPPLGTIVRRGRPAYEVDGRPVPLLYGARPVWRSFVLGMTDGTDVRQLERNLTALGYGGGLTADRHFSFSTYLAVRRWQKDAHLPVTGGIPLGQIVFVPGPIRVSAQDVKVGMPLRAGLQVEHGTRDMPAVTVQLDPALSPAVHEGDAVVVTMPDGRAKDGRISDVGAVAVTPPPADGGGGGPVQSLVPVTIELPGAGRTLDQAQVQVSIVSGAHRGVLAVPIVALLARPGGAYEVVTVSGGVRRPVPIQPGLFDQQAGLVEVTGAGLAEGQYVEVPDAAS